MTHNLIGYQHLRKSLVLILVVVLMTFSLSGCSNNTEAKVPDLSKEVKEFNESITKVGAEDTSANEGLVIGSVNMGMNGEWFSEVLIASTTRRRASCWSTTTATRSQRKSM